MQPFPHPNDAVHKIWSRLAYWHQRHSSSNVWNFCHWRESNSKMSGLIWPKFKCDQALMPVLVISNFDDDSIENERASMETPFFHYKPMGDFLDVQGQLTPQSVVRSGRNSNLFKILCMYSLPASIWRIGSKATEKRWRHHFPHYKSMGAFFCHGHQKFDPICLKTVCTLSPTPVMLHIKFDQDLPTGLRDIKIRKCKIFVIQGRVTPKLVVWSCPKSNSCKLLCLSWLPATLMMILSKMNELAWRQHFPIISLWENFLDAQGHLAPYSVVQLAEIRTHPRFYACPHYLQVWKGSDQRQPRKRGDIFFPIISQWGLSVAMVTRVLIQSAPKPCAAFPPPQWYYT